MVADYDAWKSFICEQFDDVEIQRHLVSYVGRLLEQQAVVIFEIEHLAKLLGIQPCVLNRMIAKPESFYYQFTIPKRSSGLRAISAPYPVLLSAQRWIYKHILSTQSIHPAAYGFVKNRTIVDNAQAHVNNERILKLDLENFSPSISKRRVIAVFHRIGYTPVVAYYLASLCCLDNVLPQGAPTSPVLSNLIAKRLDFRMEGIARKNGLVYTRYADDLVFSGEAISGNMPMIVKHIIQDEGFKVNTRKTRFMGCASQKIITGLSISSGKVTIPKTKKREIRQVIYYIRKNGVQEHMKQINSQDSLYLYRLLGYLSFWQSVEPKSQFVTDAFQMISQLLVCDGGHVVDDKNSNVIIDVR